MSQSNFPPLDLVRFQTESFSYYSLSNLSGCVSQVMQNKNHPVQIPLDDKKVELSFFLSQASAESRSQDPLPGQGPL